MNNQNNDMFSNMMQPSAIPEVKDNSNMVQGNGGVNSTQSNNLNQVNNVGTFVIPQSNSASNEISGTMVSGNDLSQVNNNSFINSGTLNTSLDSNNNMMQSNTSSSNAPLDFGFPSNSGTVNNANMNNDFNLGGVGSSSMNSVEQSPLQPVNDMMNFGVGGDNNASGLENNGLNIDLNNGLSMNNVATNSVSSTPVSQVNETVNQNEGTEEVVSVKKYLIHMLLCCIPLVGIIILIMRALDRKDKNISNLARAQLLISAIVVLLSVVMMFVMSSLITSLFSNSLY